MEIVTALISHLINNAAVYAIFGNRITAYRVPDNQVKPNARISLISNPRQYHMAGESGRVARVQIDVYGETPLSMDESAEAIKNALSGYAGVIGSINVGFVYLMNDIPTYNPEARCYQRVIDMEVATND